MTARLLLGFIDLERPREPRVQRPFLLVVASGATLRVDVEARVLAPLEGGSDAVLEPRVVKDVASLVAVARAVVHRNGVVSAELVIEISLEVDIAVFVDVAADVEAYAAEQARYAALAHGYAVAHRVVCAAEIAPAQLCLRLDVPALRAHRYFASVSALNAKLLLS